MHHFQESSANFFMDFYRVMVKEFMQRNGVNEHDQILYAKRIISWCSNWILPSDHINYHPISVGPCSSIAPVTDSELQDLNQPLNFNIAGHF